MTDPAVIRQIQQIGGRIEPTIAGKLAHAAEARNKARTAIPLFHEQGFKGQGRLQQWVNTQLINPVRRHTHLAVEIWDKGRPGEGTDGIALDNTFGVFHVNNKVIGALGSPYFLKAMRSGASLGRWILQLPVAGLNFDLPIHQVLQARRDFAQSARLLGQVDTHVPDGSQGIARMIQDYQGSDLERLHQAMDNSWGDEPQTFDAGYRRDNYEAIIRQTRQPEVVRNSIQYANPMLLQNRFFLDHLIFQVFAAMGGSPDNLAPAPHVAGLLRAIYEDPRYGWGETWTRHQDALRWARGSVEQALGQMFEK